MESGQILLNLFKQQHYDATRYKMQKIVMVLSVFASAVGLAVMIIFYTGMPQSITDISSIFAVNDSPAISSKP